MTREEAKEKIISIIRNHFGEETVASQKIISEVLIPLAKEAFEAGQEDKPNVDCGYPSECDRWISEKFDLNLVGMFGKPIAISKAKIADLALLRFLKKEILKRMQLKS